MCFAANCLVAAQGVTRGEGVAAECAMRAQGVTCVYGGAAACGSVVLLNAACVLLPAVNYGVPGAPEGVGRVCWATLLCPLPYLALDFAPPPTPYPQPVGEGQGDAVAEEQGGAVGEG